MIFHFRLFLLLLVWIEKQSSRGCLLEYCKSSGTNIMMRGPIVSVLYEGRNKQASNS